MALTCFLHHFYFFAILKVYDRKNVFMFIKSRINKVCAQRKEMKLKIELLAALKTIFHPWD